MLIVVPGIRLEKKRIKKDDQKRILTPKKQLNWEQII